MLEFNLTMDSTADPDMLYDLIIIGGGPAGMTAGLYAARYKLNTLMLEKAVVSGGQLTSTEWVENYPGFPEPVLGQQLAKDMESQAKSFGLKIVTETVNSVDLKSKIKTVTTAYNTWRAKSILIATGASPRKLNAPGEKEFSGRGISYCATCDGPFYPDKVVAVIGGGNSAFEESLFLAKYARQVHIFNRDEIIIADQIIQDRVAENDKISLKLNTTVEDIAFGDPENKHLLLKDQINGKTHQLKVDGLFIFIGNIPNTVLFKGQLELEEGYIVTDRDHKTNLEGVWAAGDVQSKALRQVATAVGDGACAAHWINKYLENWED